jgi:hypothetical protein
MDSQRITHGKYGSREREPREGQVREKLPVRFDASWNAMRTAEGI